MQYIQQIKETSQIHRPNVFTLSTERRWSLGEWELRLVPFTSRPAAQMLDLFLSRLAFLFLYSMVHPYAANHIFSDTRNLRKTRNATTQAISVAEMTLIEFSLAYSECSFTELKRFIRDRGIDAKLKDRKHAIRALQAADREATFRFFDLPPELRNLVYGFALEVEDVEDDNKLKHVLAEPAILASCRQVYNEASGLLYGDRYFRLKLHLGKKPYTLFLHLNGRFLRKAYAGSHDDLEGLWIDWPSFLNRIQHLDVVVQLDKSISPRLSPAGEKGARLMNLALHELQQTLAKKSSVRSLRVKVVSYAQLSDKRLRDVLSPISAIASRVGATEFFFTNVSDTLQFNLKEVAMGLRQLRNAEDGIRLAMMVKRDSNTKERKEELDRYERLMLPNLIDGVQTYASDRKLKRAIGRYEAILEKVGQGDRRNVSWSVRRGLKRLRGS